MTDPGPFSAHRGLLFTVAYEITGSVVDAEDVVQETWLRWSSRPGGDDGSPEEVHDVRAYLVRIATRLALNAVRSRTRRQEDYVGPWLPEPLLTTPDVADDVVMSESVSMAMLLVLESLSPQERAVFVLREVFGFAHGEIGEAVGRSDAAVRQIAHRAREAVQARRPRFETDPAQVQSVLERFWAAVTTGELEQLMDVLAPDVVVHSDGGGIRSAARRPVSGRDNAGRLILGLAGKATAAASFETVLVNGMPGVVLRLNGEVDTVAVFETYQGLVSRIYMVRNPDKLTSRDPVRLSR
ncbi:RNA polymerase sigma-70 factor [Nakamurella alba]|uniref:RNA polymerase sigma-70 factor n=1 Tax=Nakamurella alba TaxID=2665158 RepID=UPI002AC360C5|nr:RNA polymerase sigma-70 factor [Nakamurella alba]